MTATSEAKTLSLLCRYYVAVCTLPQMLQLPFVVEFLVYVAESSDSL